MQVRATFVTKCDQVRRGAIGYRIGYTEDYGMVHAATVTLSEFLLARIAEDEAPAEAALEDADREEYQRRRHGGGALFRAHYGRHHPKRVLAECEAKRRIVEWCMMPVAGTPEAQYGWAALGEAVLPALALPYADHPDYREEWKP